jgi:cellobiose phosphorylase
MYRVGLEAILGVRRVGGTLQVDPCIPKGWSEYQVTYRVGDTVFHIRVENPSAASRGVQQVTVDGKVLPGSEIPLVDDGGEHRVNVVMAAISGPQPGQV